VYLIPTAAYIISVGTGDIRPEVYITPIAAYITPVAV